MKQTTSLLLALALCLGLAVPALAAGGFTDVPENNWASPYVERAAQAGWVSGTGNGKYEPDQSVTYSQFAVMLSKALYPDDFAAQPAGAQWWTPACEVADKHGLFKDTDMANRSDWTAVANTPIERDEMAQMMYNALIDVGAKLPSYEEYSEAALGIGDIIDTDNYDAVAICYAVKLLSGNGSGYFNPHDPMTRAQAAVVLCNTYAYVTGNAAGLDQPVEPEQPAGKPAGALGGHYDTSKYNVPADANKDGWLTEDEVAAVIAQIMEEYPEGTPWGEDKFYRGTGWPNGGYACAAFAQMASDRIFGDLPTRVLRDVYSIRIGDVSKSTTPHWAMVRKIWWYDEDPAQGATYDIAGNVGGEIGVGIDAFGELDASVKRGGLTIWTRYPAES